MSDPDETGCSARPRCSETARASILDAAREEFTRESYGQVGLRKIASEAGYDKALVHRYFGSKEELFREVLKCVDRKETLVGSPREIAEALADKTLETTPEQGPLTPLLMMLRSIGCPGAADIAYQAFEDQGLDPLAEVLEGEEAHLRAGVAIAVAVGTVLLAKVAKSPSILGADPDRLRARLVAVLEAALAPEVGDEVRRP